MAKAKMKSIITIPTNNKIYGLDEQGNLWVCEPDGKPPKWIYLQTDPELPIPIPAEDKK